MHTILRIAVSDSQMDGFSEDAIESKRSVSLPTILTPLNSNNRLRYRS